jgi:hypothetical protein
MALCCLRIFSFLFSWSKDMPITLGNTTITGLGVGGLPSGTVNATTLADSAVTRAKMGYAGAVLQVVQTVKTDRSSTTSMSPVDVPGLSVSITPTSASSKILVITNINYGGGSNMYGAFFVQRGTSNLVVGSYATGSQSAATIGVGVPTDNFKTAVAAHTFLDSPNTTGAITYKVQFQSRWESIAMIVNAPQATDNNTYIVNGTSSITVMEIAG